LKSSEIVTFDISSGGIVFKLISVARNVVAIVASERKRRHRRRWNAGVLLVPRARI